jgi:undecaprenyl-diphosphatase
MNGKPVRLFLLLAALLAAAAAWPDQEPAFRAGNPALAARLAQPAMTGRQAVILGAVEGVTEFLPVSSTGHLLIVQRLLGLSRTAEQKSASDAYAICIQLGAILAVFVVSFGRIRRMVLGIFGRDPQGLRLLGKLAAAFIPAAVIGLFFEERLKRYLFGVWPIVAAWAVGGVFILLALRRKGSEGGRALEELTWREALIIGVAQCFALWPGVSRSLATLGAAVLLGLSLPAAVEFSFLLGLVTLGAATIYEGLKQGRQIIALFGWANPVLGLVIAALTAFIAVRWMLGYLTKRSLAVFGWYRIGLAGLAAALLFTGIL